MKAHKCIDVVLNEITILVKEPPLRDARTRTECVDIAPVDDLCYRQLSTRSAVRDDKHLEALSRGAVAHTGTVGLMEVVVRHFDPEPGHEEVLEV